MAKWRDDLRRLLGGRMLLRGVYLELKGLRQEVARLAATLERVYPPPPARDPSQPEVEITHVDSRVQEEFMDIELRLTTALGQPPSERQVLEEYQQRHPDVDFSEPIAWALAAEREERK